MIKIHGNFTFSVTILHEADFLEKVVKVLDLGSTTSRANARDLVRETLRVPLLNMREKVA
jgi:hypothetical protein